MRMSCHGNDVTAVSSFAKHAQRTSGPCVFRAHVILLDPLAPVLRNAHLGAKNRADLRGVVDYEHLHVAGS